MLMRVNKTYEIGKTDKATLEKWYRIAVLG